MAQDHHLHRKLVAVPPPQPNHLKHANERHVQKGQGHNQSSSTHDRPRKSWSEASDDILGTHTLRFGAGVSLEEVIVRHAVGAGLDGLRRETQASGVMMLPIRAAGVLEKVSGQAEALAVDGVVGLEITIPPGRTVVPLPEGDRYLGFLFARGPTAADVELALRRAEAALDVVVGPGS